jgi:hypothetical protein
MVKFYTARDGVHKLIAVFDDGKQLPFGAFGYDDFITSGGDLKKKKSYLARHRANEDWNNPRTAGALSRWILWNKPDLEDSIRDYAQRFRMRLE